VSANPKYDRPVRIAKRIYNWYVNPTEDPDVLDKVVSTDDMRATFHVSSNISDSLLLKRTFQSDDFASQREALLSKWSPIFEHHGEIGIETAREFLRYWVGSVDHRLLYSHHVMAGKTHAQRSIPSSDFVTSYFSNRDAWTLHLTSRGSVTYSAGVPIEAQRGDLMLIAPDASVHYSRHYNSDEWLHYWAVFEPRASWIDLMQWPLRAYSVRKLSIENEAAIFQIESLFEQMIDTRDESSLIQERLLSNFVEQILIRAQYYSDATKAPVTDPRIKKASDYMLQNLEEVRSVAEVAEACNLSESRLSHLFQKHVGMGVQKFRNSLRLQRAKKLLATTSAPIAAVAREVGWNEPANFSRFFSRHIGCSPKQFRTTFSRSSVRENEFMAGILGFDDGPD